MQGHPRVVLVEQAMGSLDPDIHADALALAILDRMLLLTRRRAAFGAKIRHDDAWLHPSAVLRVLRHVLADPCRDHSLRAIADEIGLSVAASVRAIRGATGLTPGALVFLTRAWAAVEFLRDDALLLAEVAIRSGYASPSHLTSALRRVFGMPPSRLRAAFVREDADDDPVMLARRIIRRLGTSYVECDAVSEHLARRSQDARGQMLAAAC